MVPLSAVIITKNEENNIRACLESIRGWADEIIVVDDASADRTVEIARTFTDRIVIQSEGNEGRQRNRAYQLAKNEWVLSLDADEQATDELKKEIDEVLTSTFVNGFAIPRRNYIGDYWMKYGGQYPAQQLKLFRKGCLRYEEAAVHPKVFLDGEQGTLKNDIIHKSYRSFEHYIDKFNRQTTLEAEKWVQSGQTMRFGRVIRRAFDRFLRIYLRKRGLKDGFVGFMMALLAALYQIISYAKYWEKKKSK